MSIDGDFDGAVITLLVTVATDLGEAHINGVIGGHDQHRHNTFIGHRTI